WTYLAAGVALLPSALRAGGLRLGPPRLVAAWLLAGSVAGPALYFLGLRFTSGVEGVLLINLEAVFTALLALAIFRERPSPATLAAGSAILAGGLWLSWPEGHQGPLTGNALGNLLIALGYLGWATENNLGRLLGAHHPPVTLVCFKALVAAVAMGALAAAFGQPLGIPPRALPGVVVSGAFSLSLSLTLFYVALHRIGAARTGLVAASATLWGVLSAVALLGESLTPRLATGGLVMLAGLAVFAWEAARKTASDAPDGPDDRDGLGAPRRADNVAQRP
ncbi:MAG: DMT family transporter, partial [Clostridia bacterium]|nr:DMT family transporter [Clostridia bacterium]